MAECSLFTQLDFSGLRVALRGGRSVGSACMRRRELQSAPTAHKLMNFASQLTQLSGNLMLVVERFNIR